jgi:hypothetical protein
VDLPVQIGGDRWFGNAEGRLEAWRRKRDLVREACGISPGDFGREDDPRSKPDRANRGGGGMLVRKIGRERVDSGGLELSALKGV